MVWAFKFCPMACVISPVKAYKLSFTTLCPLNFYRFTIDFTTNVS